MKVRRGCDSDRTQGTVDNAARERSSAGLVELDLQ